MIYLNSMLCQNMKSFIGKLIPPFKRFTFIEEQFMC